MWTFIAHHSSDIINSFVAVGTIWMAISTGKSVKKSQESIDVARRAAEATEMSVERMKDALMPHLDLQMEYVEYQSGPNLTIKNVGTGLARIRLVTVRKDISTESVFYPVKYCASHSFDPNNLEEETRIIDFVIGDKETFTFQLKYGNTPRTTDNTWLSSISVFYEDVYGRIFQTRLLYIWEYFNSKFRIVSVGKENMKVDQLPFNPYGNGNVKEILTYESTNQEGSMIQYRPEFRQYYRLKFTTSLMGIKIPGIEFTDNKDILLKEIVFDYIGIPVFHVQIDNYVPFKVRQVITNGQPTEFDIKEESYSTVNDALENRPYQEYGLIPTGNNNVNIRSLYQQIIDTIKIYTGQK